MGESVGVSVSFGKYENDGGLCWEKWSTFSPNKYLEEVGKCSTPGSVAQKKAFFEAHYKKIAAMKAQAEEDEDHSTPDDQQIKNVVDRSGMDKPLTVEDNSPSPITTLEATNLVEPVEDKASSSSSSPITTLNSSNSEKVPNVETVKQQQHFHATPPPPPPPPKQTHTNKINPNKVEKSSIGMKKKTPNSPPTKSKPTSAPKASSSSFNKASAPSLSKVKASASTSSSLNKTSTPSSSLKKANASAPSSSLNKTSTPSSSLKKMSTPSSSLKKTSTPSSSLKKISTPSSSLKKMSTPSSSLKKTGTPSSSSSSLSSSKHKTYSASESRRVAPASFHLSMSMNSLYSDTASSVTSSRRRSLFMEQMGDKDIVKRAFKTFQNRFNQLPSSDTEPKQLPTKRPQQKTWTPMAYQKENGRSRKAAEEKINPARSQTGSLKGVGVDERTSVALKSNERRKEFFRKLEEKSKAREAERSQLSLKSKEVKNAEMKRAGQKAKTHGVLKST